MKKYLIELLKSYIFLVIVSEIFALIIGIILLSLGFNFNEIIFLILPVLMLLVLILSELLEYFVKMYFRFWK